MTQPATKVNGKGISINLSTEHAKHSSEIEKCFKDLNVTVNANIMRFSEGDLPMQIMIFLGSSVVGGIFYDLVKIGIQKVFQVFKNTSISLRTPNAMFSVGKDGSVLPIVPPDKEKEFEHIKNLDDLFFYLKEKTVHSDWIETTLGKVVEFQRGFDLPTKDRTKGIYPLVVSNGIDGLVNEYKVKGPGVVTGRSGTLGKVLFIKEDFWPLNTTLWIKDFKNNDVKFIYYWLLSFPFEKYNAGSGVPTLNRNHIHEVNVKIPINTTEQRAIAAVLSAFDDKIELLREQNRTLEDIGQTIFAEWFGRYSVERPEELPEGWKIFELSELFSFIKGKKPIETSEIAQDEFITQILIDTFNGGKTIFGNPKNMIISDEEDLIMVMDGASSGRIEFGFSGIIGSTLALLKIEKPIKSILYYFLKSKEKDIQEKTTGSAIPHTDKNKVYNYQIPLPNNEVEMQKLDIVFSDFREKIIVNRSQIQSLARSRDELLPRLMSGEVRVNYSINLQTNA